MYKTIAFFSILIIAFTASLSKASVSSIRETLKSCIEKDDSASNPTIIECNAIAISQAEKEIEALVVEIKKLLTGTDAHGRNLELERSVLDAEINSFKSYRESASSVAAVLNGGTGSDLGVVSSTVRFDLTIGELERLKKLIFEGSNN